MWETHSNGEPFWFYAVLEPEGLFYFFSRLFKNIQSFKFGIIAARQLFLPVTFYPTLQREGDAP